MPEWLSYEEVGRVFVGLCVLLGLGVVAMISLVVTGCLVAAGLDTFTKVLAGPRSTLRDFQQWRRSKLYPALVEFEREQAKKNEAREG